MPVKKKSETPSERLRPESCPTAAAAAGWNAPMPAVPMTWMMNRCQKLVACPTSEIEMTAVASASGESIRVSNRSPSHATNGWTSPEHTAPVERMIAPSRGDMSRRPSSTLRIGMKRKLKKSVTVWAPRIVVRRSRRAGTPSRLGEAVSGRSAWRAGVVMGNLGRFSAAGGEGERIRGRALKGCEQTKSPLWCGTGSGRVFEPARGGECSDTGPG